MLYLTLKLAFHLINHMLFPLYFGKGYIFSSYSHLLLHLRDSLLRVFPWSLKDDRRSFPAEERKLSIRWKVYVPQLVR